MKIDPKKNEKKKTVPPKSRMGRPPLGMDAKTTVLAIRVSQTELAEWKRKATGLGMTVSQYILAPHRKDAKPGKEGK